MAKWKYYKLRHNRPGLNTVLPFIACLALDKALNFSESQQNGVNIRSHLRAGTEDSLMKRLFINT